MPVDRIVRIDQNRVVKGELIDLPNSRTFLVSCHVCIVRDDQVLLLKATSDIKGEGIYWETPGGILEFGETPQEAAIREVKEETGLGVEIKEVLLVDSTVRFANFRFKDGSEREAQMVKIFFAATLSEGELNLSSEHIGIEWIKKDQIDQFDLSTGTKIALKKLWPN